MKYLWEVIPAVLMQWNADPCVVVTFVAADPVSDTEPGALP